MEAVKKIVIVGGGFTGIKTALKLSATHLPSVKIQLISDKPHFEYHAALYKVLAGHSPLEVCLRLTDIFAGKNVEIINDTITEVDVREKRLVGESGSHYQYDELVLALGSELNYYDTPGLEEFSYNVNSIQQTLRLRRHLHEMFAACVRDSVSQKKCAAHVVIIGGGATGCEVAGELSTYLPLLAKRHYLDPVVITIDLVQAGSRLLPQLPEAISRQVTERLRRLGVHIMLNQRLLREELETVYVNDEKMKTKTVIWTAGVKPNRLYATIAGIQVDEKGRVMVSNQLQAVGVDHVYVGGDGAALPFSGMAAPALADGGYIAEHIIAQVHGWKIVDYKQKLPGAIIPIGQYWGVALLGKHTIIGFWAWVMRRFVDLRFYLSILPVPKAILAFESDGIHTTD